MSYFDFVMWFLFGSCTVNDYVMVITCGTVRMFSTWIFFTGYFPCKTCNIAYVTVFWLKLKYLNFGDVGVICVCYT